MSKIIPLQALRALAALSVVAAHFNQIETFLTGHKGDQFPLYFLASGVDLFFVISGFIMVHSSRALFEVSGGTYIFLTRRLGRIVPLYWLTTIIAIYAMTLPLDWQSVLTSLLFIPYQKSGGTIAPINGVGWTLNFEMFFYLLFAGAISLRQKVAVPGLIVVLIALTCLGAILSPATTILLTWSDPIILEFAFGMVIAQFYAIDVKFPIWLRLLLIVVSIFCIWMTEQQMPPSHFRALYWGVPAATIVAAMLFGTRSEKSGRISRVIDLLGNSSYALYLVHPIVGAAILTNWQGTLNTLPMRPVLAVASLTAVATSIVTYLWIEKPITHFFRIIFEGRKLEKKICPSFFMPATEQNK